MCQNVDLASNRPEQNPISNNESIVESSTPKSISRTGEVVEKVDNTTQDNKYFTNTSIDTVLLGPSKRIKSSDSGRPASFVEYKRGMPLVKDCDVNKYNIGRCIKEKPKSSYDIIKNIWKPDHAGEKKRRKRFVKNWLKEFSWLAYSKLYDGPFCIPYVFFGLSTGHNCGKLNYLYKSPLTFWTSTHSKLKAHVSERCKMHHSVIAAMGNFMLIK